MTEPHKPNVGDSVPDTSATDRREKWRLEIKAKLDASHAAYKNREPGSENNLLTLTRKFIYSKLEHMERKPFGFADLGTSETVDDWTQETLLDVWQHVAAGRVHGSFYSFVQSLLHFDKIDAKKYLMKQRQEKVSLEVIVGEDAYTGEVDEDASTENPAIYSERASWGLPSDFTFPKSLLKGIDDEVVLLASELIISGWSIKRIAARYGMTEAALSQRFERLRRRMGIEPKPMKPRAPKSAPLPMIDAMEDEVA